MGIFSRKKPVRSEKKDVATPVGNASPVASTPPVSKVSVAHILRSPRITEKATMHQSLSVYVFDVDESANKKQIAAAVSAAYKVRPRKVRVVTIPTKSVRNMKTGKSGVTKGGKKAYVYLKKGETITIA